MTTTTAETFAEPSPRQSHAALRRAVVAAVVVVLYLIFAILHVTQFLETGRPTGLVLATQESVLVFLFLIRRPAKDVSTKPLHWLAGFVGTFGLLLLRPEGWTAGPLPAISLGLQFLGSVLAIAATVALGRSFGIVAANRGVKDAGAYSIVRHPLYATYLIAQVGYLFGALSWQNVAVLLVAWAAQIVRMGAEERVLMEDPHYRTYMERVRYRLIPGVY